MQVIRGPSRISHGSDEEQSNFYSAILSEMPLSKPHSKLAIGEIAKPKDQVDDE